jgi:twitching motility protein PilI
MSSVNASFAKLLDYERRATGTEPRSQQGGEAKRGDWAGLAFRIGRDRLVCGLDRVSETLALPRVTRVPGTKPFIIGLANVHGDLLTVIDLGCYLHGTRTAQSGGSRLLATSLRGRPVGLLADEVFGQRNFSTADTGEAEVDQQSPLAPLVQKQHRSGSETWLELDLDRLFQDPEFVNGAAG